MQPPAWCADYIGVPFLERGRDRAGCDCWGLVRLVLAERFGVAVPSYAGDYATIADHGRLSELINKGISTTEAQRHGEGHERTMSVARQAREKNRVGSLCLRVSVVEPVWFAVEEAGPGDVMLLRLRGLPIHVGIVVAAGWMLHTHKAADAVLDRFGGIEWRNRVLGIYRHRELCQARIPPVGQLKGVARQREQQA